MSELLKSKALNGWQLFCLISGPISVAMLIAMTRTDMSAAEGVSSMIQLSVRCAVPLLYVAFIASSILILFPGAFGRWLLKNRSYIGLSFAAAMAWQLLFILWLTTIHRDYYVDEVYVLRDVIEGVIGYAFLIAMTITSFKFARKHLRPKQWTVLHKSGIYFLWAYAYSVYWWNLYYYGNPIWLDYLYYWTGFLACAARSAAWRKQRWSRVEKASPGIRTQTVFVFLGLVLVAIAFVMAATDAVWRGPVDALTTGHAATALAEMYLPYWPPTPFVASLIIALGAWMTLKPRYAVPIVDSR